MLLTVSETNLQQYYPLDSTCPYKCCQNMIAVRKLSDLSPLAMWYAMTAVSEERLWILTPHQLQESRAVLRSGCTICLSRILSVEFAMLAKKCFRKRIKFACLQHIYVSRWKLETLCSFTYEILSPQNSNSMPRGVKKKK